MKNRKWMGRAAATIGMGLLLASCTSGQGGEMEEGRTVKVDTVRAIEATTLLQYPGRVRAAQDITLAFRVSGTIERMLVEEGSPVKKGQLLAELDDTDYRVQLEATEAEYRQVKGEAERVIALYNDGGTTPNAYDKAVYGLQQVTAKYQHHQDELAYTRLHAPFDGTVQQRLFRAHETVGAGIPVLAVVSTGAPEVEISLPAAEYARKEQFVRFNCTFDLYPDQVYPLTLIGMTPKANANQLYTVRLQMERSEGPMPSPGMNTMVTIVCETNEEPLLSVPGGALLQENGKSYVWVCSGTGKPILQRREVEPVRLQRDGSCLVRSARLQPGEIVVASGVHHLKEGTQVKPLPAPADTNVGGLL